MKLEKFLEEIKVLGINVDETMKSQFINYKNLIQEVNKVLNLTGIDDDEGIYHKHFYDSLLISPMMENDKSVVDVGSGAGFPGIVLAIARPDLKVTCVEPTTKRTQFLSRVVSECGLKNVIILNARAEDIIDTLRETFDYATARAVAYLDILSELCIPFVRIGGHFIAMKGQKGTEEYESSLKAVHKLGGELIETHKFVDEVMGERYNLVIKKVRSTPKQYPRAYAKIKKTPLSGRKHD